MDTVAQQRFLNTVLGLTMLLFGLVFFFGAGYVYSHPPAPIGDAELITGDISTCKHALESLGHSVRQQGDELRIERTTPTFDNADRMLADASLGISSCGLPLKRFCMGPGCQPQGVSFALATKVPATRHQ